MTDERASGSTDFGAAPTHVGRRFPVGALAIAVAIGLLPAIAWSAPERAIDFNRDVRPILAGNCFACHGPDDKERKADLRLDTREGAIADLEGTHAVVPGKPEASELIARITASDDDLMPPAKTG